MADPTTNVVQAARMLTVLGYTEEGGIIIGPVGWSLLQTALARRASFERALDHLDSLADTAAQRNNQNAIRDTVATLRNLLNA